MHSKILFATLILGSVVFALATPVDQPEEQPVKAEEVAGNSEKEGGADEKWSFPSFTGMFGLGTPSPPPAPTVPVAPPPIIFITPPQASASGSTSGSASGGVSGVASGEASASG